MANKYAVFFLFFILILLTGCTTEFSCEDNGGVWSDDFCNKGTSDAGLLCTDNAECEGYCFTTKHPLALSDDKANGFAPQGTCSSLELPLSCANTISQNTIMELCQ